MDMKGESNKMENTFKTIVAVAGAILTYLFGGWSALLGILLTLVAIDYITGVASAWLRGGKQLY